MGEDTKIFARLYVEFGKILIYLIKLFLVMRSEF